MKPQYWSSILDLLMLLGAIGIVLGVVINIKAILPDPNLLTVIAVAVDYLTVTQLYSLGCWNVGRYRRKYRGELKRPGKFNAVIVVGMRIIRAMWLVVLFIGGGYVVSGVHMPRYAMWPWMAAYAVMVVVVHLAIWAWLAWCHNKDSHSYSRYRSEARKDCSRVMSFQEFVGNGDEFT